MNQFCVLLQLFTTFMYDMYGSTLFIFCKHIPKQKYVSFLTMQCCSSVIGVMRNLNDLLEWCNQRNLHTNTYDLKVL